jgi:Tfp pilus assembly protein PilX
VKLHFAPPPAAPRRLLRGRGQRGYIMLVALILLAIIAVIGATSLSVAGVDQRIALHNRKHMLVVNTAHAGTEHARWQLEYENPVNEGLDTAPDTYGAFVKATDAEARFGGLAYPHNLGVYWVEATYLRCGNPPPGYSTELGKNQFRSDYWQMTSTARMQDTSYANINETQATAAGIYRKVIRGGCVVR